MVYHAYVTADVHGIITQWSPGAELLFGHSAKDAVGRSVELIVPEEHRAAHSAGYSRAMEDPALSEVVLDVPALHSDGRTLTSPVRLIVLSDALGTALGALAVFSSEGTTGVGLAS
ncbi:PAS domain S-box protein [Streptomyces sp. NPDC001941]|uniref:PAS domain S-box protein n=1 Tax=Streptomyces sp. NPDC001941 TaxID=3154659 RepID=UPI003328D13D